MKTVSYGQILFWGAALVLFILTISLLSEVLLPFVLGLVLAYFLNPVATALENRGLSRVSATVLIAITFGIISFLFFLFVGPLLFAQLSEFATNLPQYVRDLRSILESTTSGWVGKLSSTAQQSAEEAMQNFTKDAGKHLGGLIKSIWSSGKALISLLSLVLITPVVTFFLLKDWNDLIAKIDGWLPRDHAPIIRLLTKRIDRSIDGFIHGQVTISLIVGLFYCVALTLLGLKYGLLIGLTAGVLNVIPFLGSLAGLLISGTMAIVQYWPEWQPILYVLGVFLFGQLIDANVLTPKIIGDKIKLHPVWLIFALLVAGYLFGLLGMLIAIPVAAAIGVLVRYSLERYLDSELYVGTRGKKTST